MNRTDVLRMAREAGIPDDNIPRLCHGRLETGVELLERFAALVAADANSARIAAQTENEALKAKLAASGVAERRVVLGAVREARMDEREACAKACEALKTNPPANPDDSERGFNAAIRRAAAAIRARGSA